MGRKAAVWSVRIIALAAVVILPAVCSGDAEDLFRDPELTGRHGGVLSTALRSEPKTFNPIIAVDTISRDVIAPMHADLIHINRATLQTEPALAKSWDVSKDGRVYTLRLRRGIRFSDGQPMDADDVVFTFGVYLDEASGAPQRDLLIVHGKPIGVRKEDAYTVRFELAAPYAAAERLFDGIPILPQRLLQKAAQEGAIGRAWAIGAAPEQIAGLGPFRLKSYAPGERVVLERNPYYWKTDRDGRRLPYLDGLVSHILPNEEAQTLRFIAGELDLISPIGGDNFLELRKRQSSAGFRVYDAGPGLEYSFLALNMNAPAPESGEAAKIKRSWFHDLRFRRAISRAIDRDALARLAYRGLAKPIWSHVTEGNSLWVNRKIPRPARSVADARAMLQAGGFAWRDGALIDRRGTAVAFSILVSASNQQRAKMAALIQADLRELGIETTVATLEFRTMLDRVFQRADYDAAVMAIESGDADPNSEMNVWLSSGGMHVWNLSGHANAPWEEEIDRLMRLQMITLDAKARHSLYDRVQELVAAEAPVIFLVSPSVLAGASKRLRNFSPSILRPHALWNAESLYFHGER
jgi:peptide/nickel transport system substrate-binding protein